MREIREGIYQWQAPHPEWKAGEGWDETVSSYAIDDGTHLVMFDPMGFPAELEELAGMREVTIALTCPWHRRDAEALAARFNAPVHVPPPDAASSEAPVAGDVYRAGDRLPGGIQALPGMEDNDLVLWIGDRGVLVAGDSVIDRGHSLEVPSEWIETRTRAAILEALRPLLELPVELVLPTHGDPADGAALRRALR